MENKYSIIIPTMWRSELIHQMLPLYDRSEYVGEVIIIDNDPSKMPDLSQFEKVRHYAMKENIYVNPAWNLGVSLANHGGE